MDGETRRKEIIKFISESDAPVSGTKLANHFHVSRQVIVQDIALLRAADWPIISTYRGYLCQSSPKRSRVLKVFHTDQEMRKELNLIVDMGGTVEDVFIRHRVFGELRAPLHITSRLKVEKFMEDIQSGKSSQLKNITFGYHYHTVSADSEEALDAIEAALRGEGICIEMADYEKN